MITLSVHWTYRRPVTHAQIWASYSTVYRLCIGLPSFQVRNSRHCSPFSSFLQNSVAIKVIDLLACSRRQLLGLYFHQWPVGHRHSVMSIFSDAQNDADLQVTNAQFSLVRLSSVLEVVLLLEEEEEEVHVLVGFFHQSTSFSSLKLMPQRVHCLWLMSLTTLRGCGTKSGYDRCTHARTVVRSFEA